MFKQLGDNDLSACFSLINNLLFAEERSEQGEEEVGEAASSDQEASTSSEADDPRPRRRTARASNKISEETLQVRIEVKAMINRIIDFSAIGRGEFIAQIESATEKGDRIRRF